MVSEHTLTIDTRGRGTTDITGRVAEAVRGGGVGRGLCHCFVQHTSASLILSENADPQVRRDLEAFLARLVPDGDALFGHDDEGPDDMPAHIRTILTTAEITLPIRAGRLALGIWQGIYLYEHRRRPHTRRVLITVYGEP
jgi:secondary thiamine-phosphate synthase enzyme